MDMNDMQFVLEWRDIFLFPSDWTFYLTNDNIYETSQKTYIKEGSMDMGWTLLTSYWLPINHA